MHEAWSELPHGGMKKPSPPVRSSGSVHTGQSPAAFDVSRLVPVRLLLFRLLLCERMAVGEEPVRYATLVC